MTVLDVAESLRQLGFRTSKETIDALLVELTKSRVTDAALSGSSVSRRKSATSATSRAAAEWRR